MREQIRVLVADDEPLARRMLHSLLARDPEILVVGEACDGRQTRANLEALQPDLAILDIQMPFSDGFDALQHCSGAPHIIFITAHPEHALRAFEADAVDYVLKPFDDARFERALLKGKSAVRTRRFLELAHTLTPAAVSQRNSVGESDRLPLNEGRQIVFVPAEDIDWIEAADYYVQVHVNGRAYLIRESMHELEERLASKRFLRVHRRALVNTRRIQRIERVDGGDLIVYLQNSTRIAVSRARRTAVIQQLGIVDSG